MTGSAVIIFFSLYPFPSTIACLMPHNKLPRWLSGKEPLASSGHSREGSVPGSGKSPGEGNGNHSSILAWKIAQMEEPGGLLSMGPQRVRHN